jgi:hypothetical protein
MRWMEACYGCDGKVLRCGAGERHQQPGIVGAAARTRTKIKPCPLGGGGGFTRINPLPLTNGHSRCHVPFRHGVGRGTAKFPTFRSPSSRRLSCIHTHMTAGNLQQGRETTQQHTRTSNPPPIPNKYLYRVFLQSPRPYITIRNADLQEVRFSASPLPAPAVGGTTQCRAGGGGKTRAKCGRTRALEVN